MAIIAILNFGFFIPADRKLLPMVEGALADAGGRELQLSDLPEEYQRKGKLEGILGTVTGILLVVAIYMMVIKPGL